MRRVLLLPLLALACSETRPPATGWRPGQVLPSPAGPNLRGFLDRRGLIHAHSIWSHDACDDAPVKNGARDQACDADFRAGLCAVKHDFVFLTDHESDFALTTMAEALLFRPERGDELLPAGADPVANRAGCPDGHRPLILAGFEAGTMTVGLDHHLPGTVEERRALYKERTPERVASLRQAGGKVLLAHTEDWTPDQLLTLGVDGFEMYNLHANALRSAGTVLELAVLATDHPDRLPYPDLIFLPLFTEDPRYLATWSAVLARGARLVTTLGTDCHQNSFPALLPDGERGDSYRRMMGWFSNHLLVRPDSTGRFDAAALKEALGAGRLYGVFEALGYAEGFDYHAESTAGVVEMGGAVALADRPVLALARPKVQGLGADRAPPELTLRLLVATAEGFVEVARGTEALRYAPTEPGAYRAEVRMVPRHLAGDLGQYAAELLGRDTVWIYANAIHVE